ncbi:MAG TPA: hypothetical protein V6D00_15575 [Pantanalinema sp.]
MASLLTLFARAVLVQLLVGAPFGIQDFSAALERTHQPLVAWLVAYAYGCFRAVGLPWVLGGLAIGLSEKPGRMGAIAIAALPVALVAGGYFAWVAGMERSRMLGGIAALWLLGTVVSLVGYGLGRILRQARLNQQEGRS